MKRNIRRNTGNAKKQKKLAAAVFLLLMLTVYLCGCGGPSVSGENSPVLENCTAQGMCEGGEQDQYIIAELEFDRPVAFSEDLKDQLGVVIGGQRIDPENIGLSAPEGENTIRLKMAVQQVNDGYLEIRNAPGEDVLTALTDAEGKYCTASVDVKQLIPSGAAIETLSSSPEQTVCRVTQTVTHRSIIWIQLFSGDQAVEPEDPGTTDVMEGSCAVHQHEFLWVTEESTAEDIAETINNFYGENYSATAEGDQVTVNTKSGTGSGNLELRIYEGKNSYEDK